MRIVGLLTRALLLLLGLRLLLLLFVPPRVIDLDAPTYDPAIETELRARSDDYGSVDRWIFPGIEAGLMVHRLSAEGYTCPAVQDRKIGGTPGPGVHVQTCTRLRGFPLSRELIVQAEVDYDHGRQVIGIKAYSVDASSNTFRQRYARLLRQLGVIEPAVATVRGLSFASSADLARYVADAVNPRSWRGLCGQVSQVALDVGCRIKSEQRHEQGLPAVAGERISVSLLELMRSLEAIGIRTRALTLPVGDAPIPRHTFEEPIPVRAEAGELWLDASGPDFTGALRQVSVLIAPEGGTPLSLQIQQGGDEAVEVVLKGTPRKTGMDEPYVLLVDPESVYEEAKTARWVIPGRTEARQ